VSLLTVFSMTKIWAEVFWKAEPDQARAAAVEEAPSLLTSLPLLILPIAVLAAITIVIGLFSEPLFILAMRAAEQLLDPTSYIEAVRPVGGL
jgi:multicomponent Na+:H+ antiporter subunit D